MRQTIQIIRLESPISATLVKENTDFHPSDKIGEYSFVASKRGKYYYPKTCSKAKALSIKNMLYFKDKIAASSAGFIEYIGCK